jgi:hypothetical protein
LGRQGERYEGDPRTAATKSLPGHAAAVTRHRDSSENVDPHEANCRTFTHLAALPRRYGTTLAYTGSPPIVTIAPADSAAYAAKEGVLCSDVFAAS